MKYRKLGNTGIEVSEIGLGTAQLGGPSLINGRRSGYAGMPREIASRILEKAFDAGVTFFDSSDKYGDGEAERLLGAVFRRKRDQVVLATKCGITSGGERRFDRDYLTGCLHGSLKNLGTDYLDLFQLTKPPLDVIENGEIYETLDAFKRQGKIRFCGVSTGTDEETLRLIADRRVDSLQVFYNLLHTAPEEFFLERAHAAGMGVIVRSPLSSGTLCGRHGYETRFGSEDDRSNFLHGETLRKRVDMVQRIVEANGLDESYGILHFSLNYLLSSPHIATIIPGASKMSQLEDILKLVHVERMSREKFEEVGRQVRELEKNC